jgi:hypothetical protein
MLHSISILIRYDTPALLLQSVATTYISSIPLLFASPKDTLKHVAEPTLLDRSTEPLSSPALSLIFLSKKYSTSSVSLFSFLEQEKIKEICIVDKIRTKKQSLI